MKDSPDITLQNRLSIISMKRGSIFPGKAHQWTKPTEFLPISQAEMAIFTSLLQSDFTNIKKDVCKLVEEIKQLQEKPTFYTIKLYDLGNKKYNLKGPIDVVIEAYEDEFIAKFSELEIFGAANTESEAILELKKEIIDLYDELFTSAEKDLGPLPQMWRRILLKLISKR